MIFEVAIKKLAWYVRLIGLMLVCSFAVLGQDGPNASHGGAVADQQVETQQRLGDEKSVQDYVISPDDLLDVYVMDVAELSRSYRVSATGKVVIPLLSEPIAAAELTLAEFSRTLADKLRSEGLVSSPHVSTSVQQSRLHSIAITGAVKSPQIYPVLGRTSLLDVLSQAGGITEDAGNTVIIHRVSKGTPSEVGTLTVDLQRLLEGGDSTLNVEIYPGDRVLVPHGGFVYVVGAVNRPGGFAIKSGSKGLTVLQAIALAQDTRPSAKRKNSLVIRRGPQSTAVRSEIAINLSKILSGQSPDLLLQADDILFVPDSTSKRILRRGSEAVLQVATGVALYRSY